MKLSPNQRKALTLVADGKFYPVLAKEDDGWHARWRAIGVDAEGVNAWVDEYVREAAMTRLSEDAENDRHETLHDAWLMALKSVTGLVVWDDDACAAFAAELEAWGGNAAADVAVRRAIVFRFAATGDAAPFRLSCDEPRGRRALAALGQATYVSGLLRGLRRDPGASGTLSVSLSHVEAEDFILRGARELRDAGYAVEGVDLAARVDAAAEIQAGETSSSVGSSPTLKLTVRVAGEIVSAEEIRFLLDQGSTLVYFRDRWIEVDRGILREALRALEKGVDRRANPLAFALGIGHVGKLELEEVKSHGWLRGLVNELRRHSDMSATLEPVGRITGFDGELRDYQARGVAWLAFLTDHGFGALLADDMGLGKTIQTIGWLLANRSRRASGPEGPVLIVAPLTLLSNWRHEFAKFAPAWRVYVHQGDDRRAEGGFARVALESDVTLTSYNLLVKDYRLFSEVAWSTLIIDEAQAIKNPDTQVARAVKALSPRRRVALTGTPVENSVADLWSVEDFLNPGFLGDRKTFADRFVRPIAVDGQSVAGKRLRHALEPFVLRRLKTDARIAAELGEKREIREYCALTQEQRRDYESALADFRSREHAQGDVFALLTELKLVCDGAGKLERLVELLTAIFESGESALVFTQYAKVGAWLQEELAKRLGRRFPFLHGAQTPKTRDGEIAKFNRQGATAFILSLKAGGYGLNLTKATHVIHFDRWWNPAVESQATDRAHRIGQTKTVFVHLFITEGTLEEHVDEILVRKAAVAETVITAAEWLEAARLDEQA